MLNIVVGDSAGGLFRYHFNLKDEEVDKEMLVVRDDLSLGPIRELDTEQGIEERAKWLDGFYNKLESLHHEDQEDLEMMFIKTHQNVHDRLKRLNLSDEEVVIWHGPNAGDQVTLRYIISMIHSDKIHEVSLEGVDLSKCSDRPRYARALGECSPEYFDLLLDRKDHMSLDRVQKLKNEWKYLRESSSVLRVMENYEIKVADVNHLDEEIMKKCTFDFEPAARVIGRFLGETIHFLNDAFVDFRLRTLIKNSELAVAGDLKTMRDYCVKLKSSLARKINESLDIEPPIDSEGYQHVLLETCVSKQGGKISQRVDLDITPKHDWDQIDLSNKMILNYNLDNCLSITWYRDGKKVFGMEKSKVLNVELVHQSMRREYGKDVLKKIIRMKLEGAYLQLQVKPNLELTLVP